MKKFIGSLLILIFCFSVNVSAGELIDINKKASITINHSYDNKPLDNVQCNIYKVATLSSTGYYSITDEFKEYPIDFNQISDPTEWYQVADTLESYVSADGILPYKIEKTSEAGSVKFSELGVGLYLVSIDNSVCKDGILKTKPFLVSLPSISPNNGWLYDVEVNPKCEEINSGITDFKVNKVWTNDEGLKVRPPYINVDLYKNGEVFDSIILNEENNWTYLWNGLDSEAQWTIIEKDVPKDYVVSYEKYEGSITINNKYLNGEEIDTDEISNSKPVKTGVDLPIIPFTMLAIGGMLLFLGRKK